MIHIIRTPATKQEPADMLETLETYIKLDVDIDRSILAGGAALHADCEALLLDDGSGQESVGGADWIPRTQQVAYEALINLRPRQDNLSMTIESLDIRAQVERITRQLWVSG